MLSIQVDYKDEDGKRRSWVIAEYNYPAGEVNIALTGILFPDENIAKSLAGEIFRSVNGLLEENWELDVQ